MIYQQKPIQIEAHLWDESQSLTDWPKWMQDAYHTGKIQITRQYKGAESYLTITKNQGSLRVYPGNYICMGVRGGVYPCRFDTFHESHSLVESA